MARRSKLPSYRSIAKKAGLTVQHTSRVMKGVRGCSLVVASRIAEACGITIDELWEVIRERGGGDKNYGRKTRREKLEEYYKAHPEDRPGKAA